MAEKTGAGGKPQEYNKETGQYGNGSSGKPTQKEKLKALERKYEDNLSFTQNKHYSKRIDSAVYMKYSSVRKEVEKKGFAIIYINDGEKNYLIKINKSDNDFDYDIIKSWRIK